MLERAFVERSRPGPPTPPRSIPWTRIPNCPGAPAGPWSCCSNRGLTALHYPCGAVDGKYDYRTRDAVMAFEKYERLKRTGVVDGLVWQHLFAAQAPTPVLVKSGDRVEVDLTRQVLMMIVDNKVIMTIHVSTGKLRHPHRAPGTCVPRARAGGVLPGADLLALLLHAEERHPRLPERPYLPGQPWLHPHPDLDRRTRSSTQLVMGIPVDVFYTRCTSPAAPPRQASAAPPAGPLGSCVARGATAGATGRARRGRPVPGSGRGGRRGGAARPG